MVKPQIHITFFMGDLLIYIKSMPEVSFLSWCFLNTDFIDNRCVLLGRLALHTFPSTQFSASASEMPKIISYKAKPIQYEYKQCQACSNHGNSTSYKFLIHLHILLMNKYQKIYKNWIISWLSDFILIPEISDPFFICLFKNKLLK